MFDEKEKRTITKALGGNSQIVASFDPDMCGFSGLHLFVGTGSRPGMSGVKNFQGPIEINLRVKEMEDLQQFIVESLALCEKSEDEVDEQ